MSDSFKWQVSVKDADGDMVNVRADSQPELEAALLEFPVAAYAQFKANVRGSQALGGMTAPDPQFAGAAPQAPQQQAAPPQNNGWGQPPVQQQAPQQQRPQGGYNNGAQLHPEGKQCETCGEVLQYGKTRTNKGQWKCPQYRWNNGNPNNHTLEWA